MANKDSLPDRMAVALSSYGIIFLGTPHQGTNSADWGNLILNIKSIIRPTSHTLLQHLQPESEALQLQQTQFGPIGRQFDIKCFYEMYETPVLWGGKKMVGMAPTQSYSRLLIVRADCPEIFCCWFGKCRADWALQGPHNNGQV